MRNSSKHRYRRMLVPARISLHRLSGLSRQLWGLMLINQQNHFNSSSLPFIGVHDSARENTSLRHFRSVTLGKCALLIHVLTISLAIILSQVFNSKLR